MACTVFAIFILIASLCASSCTKINNTHANDSGTFYFHLHTQIIDSTIGGNTDGADSNATGPGASPWYKDGKGRLIELLVPQFFISNIKLANANGTMLTLKNVVLLKGLDSEVYYLCKVPVGTYTSATFTVGLANSDSSVAPGTLFLTDGIPFPTESTMWNGSSYYGMKITGAYDTTATGTGINPIPFIFNIPNGLTIASANQVSLPTRGTGAYASYRVYVLTAGGTQYVHILCDYGKLLSSINLKTSNQTAVNPLIADTLASNISSMFRYEE